MGIPLTALGIRPPAPTASPLDQLQKVVQLKSVLGQQKIQAGQEQIQGMQITAAQKDLADEKAIEDATAEWTGDPKELSDLLRKHKVPLEKISPILKGFEDAKASALKNDVDTNKLTIDRNNQLAGMIDSLEGVDDAQLPQAVTSGINQAAQAGLMSKDEASAYLQGIGKIQDPSVLRAQLAVKKKALLGHTQIVEEANNEQKANKDKFLTVDGEVYDTTGGKLTPVKAGNPTDVANENAKATRLYQIVYPGKALPPDLTLKDGATRKNIQDRDADLQRIVAAENTALNRGQAETFHEAQMESQDPLHNVNLSLIPHGATGEDLYKLLPMDAAATVKAAANYMIDPHKMISGRNAGSMTKFMGLILMANPKYDEKNFNKISGVVKDFASGKEADQAESLNKVAHHMNNLDQMIDNLDNSKSPIWNSLANEYGYQTGGSDRTNFDLVKSFVAPEIATLLSESTIPGIATAAQNFKNANSPKQLKDALTQTVALIGGRMSAAQYRYDTGTMGKVSDPLVIASPESQALLKRLGQANRSEKPATAPATAPVKQANPNAQIQFTPLPGR